MQERREDVEEMGVSASGLYWGRGLQQSSALCHLTTPLASADRPKSRRCLHRGQLPGHSARHWKQVSCERALCCWVATATHGPLPHDHTYLKPLPCSLPAHPSPAAPACLGRLLAEAQRCGCQMLVVGSRGLGEAERVVLTPLGMGR